VHLLGGAAEHLLIILVLWMVLKRVLPRLLRWLWRCGVGTRLRLGLVGALPLLVRAARRRQRIRARSWFDGEKLLVGYDARLRPVEIQLLSDSGGRHFLVLGAAGSGKTVTMTWIAVRAIERGLPVVVIDPKDDPDLRRQLCRAARAAGRRLIEWTPEGPSVFNPLAQGQDGEVADKALAGETFTEPHYMRQAQRYIGHAVRMLRSAGGETSIAALAEQLVPERLEVLLRSLPRSEATTATEAYLDALTQRQRSDLSGVRDRLAIVAESDVGRWLNPATPDAPRFDLLSALRSRAVVLFRLRSDQRPMLMRMVGAAIFLDLQTTMAALQASPLRSVAVIDEFAALSAGQVGGLFGRARGAGMSLVLGTQELADLELAGGPGLRKQVTGNITGLIAHRQVDHDSAEWVSRFSGIEALELRALAQGCAAVVGHAGHGRRTRLDARLARMLSARELG
jgi:type IV secretory pathway TraG/TraD family ATPase VirD4